MDLTSVDHLVASTSNSQSTYDGWMNSFCDEPSGDAQTCCLGFWLPCLLYGKVDERIKLVRDGKNPEEAGNGCGAECLIWQVTCGGFAGALTATRRTRTRGLYDISGLLKDDCIKSVFCNICVLMQIDREIRARNGKTSLQTSAEYTRQRSNIIKLQPTSKQMMTYAPGEGAEARTAVEDMILCRRPLQVRLHKGPKHSLKDTAFGRQHQLREVINVSGVDHTVEVVIKRAQLPTTPLRTKAKKENMGMETLEQPSILMNLVSQPAVSSTGANAPLSKSDTRSGGVVSFFTSAVPSFFSSTSKKSKIPPAETQSSVPIEVSQQQVSTPQRGHALEDCSCGSNSTEGIEHDLNNCVIVQQTSQRPSETQVSEHSLTDCDTIVIAGQRSPVNNHTSYAHDFTECQVDAGILEYFEQEEKKSKEHKLAECSILDVISSTSKSRVPTSQLKSTELESCLDCENGTQVSGQHKLSRCSSVKPMDLKLVNQHNLAECERSDSVDFIESLVIPPSTNAECCLEDSTNASVSQHNLQSCGKNDSIAVSNVNVRKQSEVRSELESHVQEDCNLCDEIKVVKQHRLSNCSRSSSMSALVNSKTQGHRLSQCPRSCSMPVLESREPLEHEIEECRNYPGSEEQEVQGHDLDECLSIIEGQSQHANQSSAPADDTKGKGKERTETKGKNSLPQKKKSTRSKLAKKSQSENKPSPEIIPGPNAPRGDQIESCNVPQHADLESQLSEEIKQHAKHTDVVVAVDVVVAGKKIKAEVIPVFDGSTSARPSQIREASAKQALSNVLASSQRSLSKGSTISRHNPKKFPYQRYPRNQKRPEQDDLQQDEVVVLGMPGPESVAASAAEQVEIRETELSAGQRLLAAVSGFVGGNREQ